MFDIGFDQAELTVQNPEDGDLYYTLQLASAHEGLIVEPKGPALALHWRTPARAVVAVLCLASLGLVAGHLLFAHIASLRYLHPMPWFVLANLALVGEAWRRRAQGPGTPR